MPIRLETKMYIKRKRWADQVFHNGLLHFQFNDQLVASEHEFMASNWATNFCLV